ncbi:hypothetical protein os4_36530 (plasmid) [Comamonadaceae bacterium OS-4]|jgi:uncharacterized membrane protein YidH (DUF202 family)|nr:hypothetical protein os4_36530 [Comamonadaceae bacterium OS-4]
MEQDTGFLSNLQTAYSDAFINSDSNVITPEIIVLVVLISVVVGVLHEKVLEPQWVKRHITKHDTFPSQKEFLWFRVGIMAMVFMGTALAMLLAAWPR